MAAHAKFSASAMDRILKCPISAILGADAPRVDTPASIEGTKAHAVAEAFLSSEPLPDYADDGMRDGAELHRATVYAYRTEETLLQVEATSAGLQSIDPELGGTTDVRMFRHDCADIVVVDYKYGKGYAVEAENNKQMLTYALGALMDAEPGVAYEAVEMTIVQPRAHHAEGPVRSWRVPVDVVWQHAEDVQKAIAAARSGTAKPCPGDHCHFCPAKLTCPALSAAAEFAAAQVTQDNGFPQHVSDAALADALDLADAAEAWIKAVRAELSHRIGTGGAVPGWKAVAKRGIRAWRDEGAAAAAILERFKAKPDDIYSRSLLSPAQIEQVVGKAQMKMLADMLADPKGGWTVARADDKRPAVSVGPATEFSPVD